MIADRSPDDIKCVACEVAWLCVKWLLSFAKVWIGINAFALILVK